jgi:hypothetical protein
MKGHFNLNLDEEKFSYVSGEQLPFIGHVMLTEKQVIAIREHLFKSATTVVNAGSNVMEKVEIQTNSVHDLPDIIARIKTIATDLEELVDMFNSQHGTKKIDKGSV